MDVDRNNKPTGTLTASFTGMCDDVTTKNRGLHVFSSGEIRVLQFWKWPDSYGAARMLKASYGDAAIKRCRHVLTARIGIWLMRPCRLEKTLSI